MTWVMAVCLYVLDLLVSMCVVIVYIVCLKSRQILVGKCNANRPETGVKAGVMSKTITIPVLTDSDGRN